MKLIVQTLTLVIVAFILMISCKTKSNLQGYTLDRNLKFCDTCEDKKAWMESNVKKYITFETDSILNYTVIYGHLGSSAKIKYRITNDTLITDKESLNGIPLTKENSEKEFANKFLYAKDSLRNIETGELFYSDEIRKKENGFNPICLIKDEKIIKLETRRKAIRYFKKSDPNKKLNPVNQDTAKIKYGIDRMYVTFKVIE